MSDTGYVDYFAILGLDESAKSGDVKKTYRHRMKELVHEIGRVQITEERRSHYLLEIAKLNAALYVLRDTEARDAYWAVRSELLELERKWCEAAANKDLTKADAARRVYDGKLRSFLAKYVEEAMLDAGRDKECVEASHWDEAHERHAFRILRHYRQGLYQTILERLPYYDVTMPKIDWDERSRTVASILEGSNV